MSLLKYVSIVCLLSMDLIGQETPLQYQTLKTSQGVIAYIDTGGKGFPIVCIHGNSCSSEVFKKQIAAFRDRYRMIAIDLPGHGRSSIPYDPDMTYTIPGYAALIHEVVDSLELGPFAIVGFSLGGNIALQWTELFNDPIQGIMIISSAPMKYSEESRLAYPPYAGGYSAFPGQLTEAQAKQYTSVCGFHIEDPSVYFMVEDAMKTDGKSREKMVASVLAGRGVNETKIVSGLNIPLAVVVGSNDSALGLEYIRQLNYRHLWRKKVQCIEDAQHAIPIQQSEELHTLLKAFLEEIQVK